MSTSVQVSRFNYIDDKGENLSASLDQPSHVALFTSDPNFTIYDSKGNQCGHTEWLTYLGTDGNIWQTKIHASYQFGPQTYHLWIESQRPDGSGNNPTFQIVDWNKHKQNMTVSDNIRSGVDPEFGMLDLGPI